jgi:hypothetical protein
VRSVTSGSAACIRKHKLCKKPLARRLTNTEPWNRPDNRFSNGDYRDRT